MVASDREAQVRDRQAAPSAVRTIGRAGRALIEQLELQLADLEETAAEAEAATEIAAKAASADAVQVRGFERKKPARGPLPDHLPRERIVYPAPSACPCFSIRPRLVKCRFSSPSFSSCFRFFGSTAPQAFFRPDRSFPTPTRTGRVKAGSSFAAHRRLGLDATEHVGTLS